MRFGYARTIGRVTGSSGNRVVRLHAILRGTIRKIADGVEYKVPPTIDDPTILTEITEDLINHKIINNA